MRGGQFPNKWREQLRQQNAPAHKFLVDLSFIYIVAIVFLVSMAVYGAFEEGD